MLDKLTFTDYVNQPQNLSLNDVMFLENAARKYPYFNLAYSLIAKGIDTHIPDASSYAIKKAAVHALSRNSLRKLLDDDLPFILAKNIIEEKVTANIEVKAPILPLISEEKITEQVASDVINEEVTHSKIEEEVIDDLSKPANIQDEQLQIIENFIKNEPRISPIRPQGEAEEELDLSESSTSLQGDFVTETYAKILAMQNNFDKAIEVYSKLIAKNPEKKAYFAEKIKALKKKRPKNEP